MINKATKQAEKSKFYRARVGCVILKGSKIIGRGFNKLRHQSTIKTDHWLGSVHAEVSAVLDAIKCGKLRDLKGSTVFVSRILKDGTHAISCPCVDCMKVLRGVGVKKVVFTTNVGELAEIKL